MHRIGTLAIGDAAVIVATAAAHRGQAFEASRALIDRLKETVPIWKHQVFTRRHRRVGRHPLESPSGVATARLAPPRPRGCLAWRRGDPGVAGARGRRDRGAMLWAAWAGRPRRERDRPPRGGPRALRRRRSPASTPARAGPARSPCATAAPASPYAPPRRRASRRRLTAAVRLGCRRMRECRCAPPVPIWPAAAWPASLVFCLLVRARSATAVLPAGALRDDEPRPDRQRAGRRRTASRSSRSAATGPSRPRATCG